MQTVSGYGIKGLLQEEINKLLRENYELSQALFAPIYPKQYIKRYIDQGVLKKIKLIRRNIPRDEADKFGVNQGKKTAKQEIIVSSILGFSMSQINKIKSCISGQLRYDKVVEIEMDDIDDVKLDFKLAGKNKTISLKNIDKTVVSEDITDQVKTVGGNPTKDSILPLLVTNEMDYLVEMGNLEIVENIVEETKDSIQNLGK